jgi:heme/copper-type cytochrome/quinol oxidase subunit 2
VKRRLLITFVLLFTALASVSSAFACATCYGKSDSALAEGMNWGIFAMLGFIGIVLVGVAGAGIFIVRRGSRLAAQPDNNPVSSTKV